MRARRLVVTVALVAACGGPDGAPVASLSVPWQSPLASCVQAQALALNMVATLAVGGNFAACTLTVASDLSASGDCGPYPTGRVRPLLVTYAMKDAANPKATPRPLAYAIGYANLCTQALEPGQTVATVSLGSSQTSAFVYRQTDVVALPTVSGDAASCSFALPESESWAREQILSRGDSLDFDGDCATAPTGPCWNLEEACAGTLF